MKVLPKGIYLTSLEELCNNRGQGFQVYFNLTYTIKLKCYALIYLEKQLNILSNHSHEISPHRSFVRCILHAKRQSLLEYNRTLNYKLTTIGRQLIPTLDPSIRSPPQGGPQEVMCIQLGTMILRLTII